MPYRPHELVKELQLQERYYGILRRRHPKKEIVQKNISTHHPQTTSIFSGTSDTNVGKRRANVYVINSTRILLLDIDGNGSS